MLITPSINFSGKCREAQEMYTKAFHGRATNVLTYRKANDPHYMPFLTEEQKDGIYHSEFFIGEQRIFMSDVYDEKEGDCYASFLTVTMDTKEDVLAAYEIMKEGSKTIIPMEATFYSSMRGTFVDKFGIRWGIMTEQTER